MWIQGLLMNDHLLRRTLRIVKRKPLGALSAVILMLLVVMAIFAPLLAPFDPYSQDMGRVLESPNIRNFFGTDQIGRDLLSRIIYGARISLLVALGATALSLVIGILIGLISGYYGKKVDFILQRIMDCLMAFPNIVLALAFMAVLGSSMQNVIISIAIVYAPRVGRVVRGNVLATREEVYVLASRALGGSNIRIMFSEILPNIMAPIIVMGTINLGHAILVEASLSFLGLGVPPPIPSWGGMLSGAGKMYMIHAPWLAAFPGLAIALVVFAFNLFGDALRDILDPRMRK